MIAVLLARYGFHIGIAAALAVGTYTWDAKRLSAAKTSGRIEVVDNSKRHGANANAKSEKARRDAAVPGSADRLRKDPATCRDCK